MSQQITRDEVSQNNNRDNLWCIIDSKVYDLTDFADAHPALRVLEDVAGKLVVTYDHRTPVEARTCHSRTSGTDRADGAQRTSA